MILKLKNFGKIAEADIKLDGVTVICGDNNTGKSTIGKALFSFFNSLYDYRTKIYSQKYEAVREFLLKNVNSFDAVMSMPVRSLFESLETFILEHNGQYTYEEVKNKFETNYPVKATKEKLMPLVDSLNA